MLKSKLIFGLHIPRYAQSIKIGISKRSACLIFSWLQFPSAENGWLIIITSESSRLCVTLWSRTILWYPYSPSNIPILLYKPYVWLNASVTPEVI